MRNQSPDVSLMGEFVVGNQRFIAWIYDGYYEDPANSYTVTPFVAVDKVIMIPDVGAPNTDFRKIYCTVPSISQLMGQDMDVIPTGLNLENRSYTARAYIPSKEDQLIIELKTRCLLIPVSIDSFGCLDTEA